MTRDSSRSLSVLVIAVAGDSLILATTERVRLSGVKFQTRPEAGIRSPEEGYDLVVAELVHRSGFVVVVDWLSA